jgi:hypothetical protein
MAYLITPADGLTATQPKAPVALPRLCARAGLSFWPPQLAASFVFEPQMQCPLLVLSGQFRRTRVSATVCPLMTQLRHWLCTAAMLSMPVSAPIEVLV